MQYSEVGATMETAPSEQTQGAVNISSAVERQHVNPWTGRDMVVILGFLSLAGGLMLHCFLLSCLGTELRSPSSSTQEEFRPPHWDIRLIDPTQVSLRAQQVFQERIRKDGNRNFTWGYLRLDRLIYKEFMWCVQKRSALWTQQYRHHCWQHVLGMDLRLDATEKGMRDIKWFQWNQNISKGFAAERSRKTEYWACRCVRWTS